MNGTKQIAETVRYIKDISVGERSVVGRSISVSGYGRSRSENVGLSNENIGENPIPRKPKVSSGRLVRGG
jgi:hypothetical protein